MKRTALLLLTLLLSVQVFTVTAHGGGDLIAGPVRTGAYNASIWVNPPQPRAGETLHFTIGLADPDDGSPVLDAQILITMQPLNDDGPVVTAEATTEQSINRLFYETDMLVDEPGSYQATFDISGPEGGGQLTLELEVQPPSKINWFLIGLGGLVIVLVLGWLRTRRADHS